MAAKIEKVTVRNELSDLPAVYAALENFAETANLPDEARRSLMLVAEELFSNTVSYGYPGGEVDVIAVSAALRTKHVELTLVDSARPFDSSVSPSAPDEPDDVETMNIGGLGLFLVHQLADQVITKRDGDRNMTIVLLPHQID
ncbi:ATP-binding protein [Roseibium sp. MMSF_3544]|uniref:ATP-binding protein n=1 Tax=unclassified Roseibium TaxID=2629323 RepID=UPI00273E1FD4|nr:ATP-binding protein [Roseibium sp. MMSF_3544]